MLCEGGHEVSGARRSAHRLPARLHPVSIDVTDRRALERTLPAADVVVYAVAAGRRDEGAYRRAYVEGVSALLDVLEHRTEPPRRVFFVSSTSVYGERGGAWIDEATPIAPRGFAGETLAAGERRMLASPLPATVVRFAGIYGPGRGWMIERARAGAKMCGRSAEVHEPHPSRRLRRGSRPPHRQRHRVRRRVHRGRRCARRGVRGPGMALPSGWEPPRRGGRAPPGGRWREARASAAATRGCARAAVSSATPPGARDTPRCSRARACGTREPASREFAGALGCWCNPEHRSDTGRPAPASCRISRKRSTGSMRCSDALRLAI